MNEVSIGSRVPTCLPGVAIVYRVSEMLGLYKIQVSMLPESVIVIDVGRGVQ